MRPGQMGGADTTKISDRMISYHRGKVTAPLRQTDGFTSLEPPSPLHAQREHPNRGSLYQRPHVAAHVT